MILKLIIKPAATVQVYFITHYDKKLSITNVKKLLKEKHFYKNKR